jgi:transcription elongation factor GreA
MELPVIQRLKKDVADLTNELNTKIPKMLAEAAAHGDLSENAEYDAAKQRQEFVRARIGQLNDRIRELSLYNVAAIPAGVVAYGSRVTVEDIDAGESLEFEIVFPEEVNAAVGQISLGSPLGRALLNRAQGDEIEVQTPRGKKTYQIIALQTLHDRAGSN